MAARKRCRFSGSTPHLKDVFAPLPEHFRINVNAGGRSGRGVLGATFRSAMGWWSQPARQLLLDLVRAELELAPGDSSGRIARRRATGLGAYDKAVKLPGCAAEVGGLAGARVGPQRFWNTVAFSMRLPFHTRDAALGAAANHPEKAESAPTGLRQKSSSRYASQRVSQDKHLRSRPRRRCGVCSIHRLPRHVWQCASFGGGGPGMAGVGWPSRAARGLAVCCLLAPTRWHRSPYSSQCFASPPGCP